jgi:hypothetical protein
MRPITCLLIVLFLAVVSTSAQSGRRIQTATAPPPVQLPQVHQTQEQPRPDESDSKGYSESMSNSGRQTLSAAAKRKSESPSGSDPKPATPEPAPADGEDVIKVETNLVTIPVSVSDRNGYFVTGLADRNFTIFENGVEQKIEYFGTTDKPFTVVLLIDVSPSTQYKIEEIQAAAWAFVQQLLAHDKVMVIQFDSRVDVLAETTGDREKIQRRSEKRGSATELLFMTPSITP